MVGAHAKIKEAKGKLDAAMAEKGSLEKLLSRLEGTITSRKKEILDVEKARVVVLEIAKDVQREVEERICAIVNVALSSVFKDPYEIKVEFVEKRNQIECEMRFMKGGNECDPMDSSGGGAIDIASIALRMAVWSLKRTRAIQILDEPAKNLSRDLQAKASEMLKTLSEDLDIQMIIVSHIEEMVMAADKVFVVEQENGYSKVKEIV